MSDFEIVARVEQRRKWSIEEKAAPLAEIEAESGKVKLVARGIVSRKACSKLTLDLEGGGACRGRFVGSGRIRAARRI